MITVKQIIKQTEGFTKEQKQQLGYYFLFSTLTYDKKQDYIKLFNYKNDFENTKEEKKRKLGLWKDKIVNVSANFNKPLEELSDYM